MMIIEMREAAIDKAFEKLDEAKHHAKNTKLTLCELEDAMYECYEAIGKQDDEEYEDREDFEIPSDEDDEELELAYRGSGSRSGMRRAMRMRYREDDDMNMRSGMRRGSRHMRSARRGYRY